VAEIHVQYMKVCPCNTSASEGNRCSASKKVHESHVLGDGARAVHQRRLQVTPVLGESVGAVCPRRSDNPLLNAPVRERRGRNTSENVHETHLLGEGAGVVHQTDPYNAPSNIQNAFVRGSCRSDMRIGLLLCRLWRNISLGRPPL
jgi:hypothetical protein